MHGNLRKLRFLPRGWAKRARMASVQSALAGLDPAPAAASPRAGGPPTYPDVRDNRPCDVLRTWRRDLRPVPFFDVPPTTRPPEGCFQSSESVPVLGDAFGGWERRAGVKMHTFRRKHVTKCPFCVLEPASSSTITVKVFTCETAPQARWLGLAIGCATGTGSSCALLGVGDVPRGTR